MARLRVCFEIDGIAEDEHGNPCPAGLQIDSGESGLVIPYEKLAKSVNLRGVLDFVGLKHIPVSAVRIITPEEYDREYGEA